MILDNWLKRFRGNEWLGSYCDPEENNTIRRTLAEIEGVGCHVEKTRDGRGWKIIVDGMSDSEPPPDYTPPWGDVSKYKGLYELISVTDDSYVIDGTMIRSIAGFTNPAGVYFLGAKKDSITAGTGFVWGGGGALGFASNPDPITDDSQQAVWLELDRKTTVVYIIAGEDFPDGTAEKYAWTEIVPLWWIPWDSSDEVIDSGNIVDMRHCVRLPGMA